jgi:hypothetical protein
MDMEKCSGLMDLFIKEIGSMEYSMVLEQSLFQMEKQNKENLKIILIWEKLLIIF